jgi:hypothetical protein
MRIDGVRQVSAGGFPRNLLMNGLRLAMVALAQVLLSASYAQAQFYGGGFNGGGFNSSGMGSFAPPHSIGGYYPMPYSTIFPGYRGGYGYPGFYGYGPGYGPYGYGGYGAAGYGYAGPGGYSGYGMPAAINTVQQSPTFIQSQTVVVPTSPTLVHTGEEIKLICPKTATGPLNYTLNGTLYTIQPGYSQNFRDDRTWKLEFQRNGQGSALVSYTLKAGTYRFGNGLEGWELRQVVSTQPTDLPRAPQPTPLPALTPGPTPLPPI